MQSMLGPLPIKETVKSFRFIAEVIGLDALFLSKHELHLLLIGLSSLITVNVFMT